VAALIKAFIVATIWFTCAVIVAPTSAVGASAVSVAAIDSYSRVIVAATCRSLSALIRACSVLIAAVSSVAGGRGEGVIVGGGMRVSLGVSDGDAVPVGISVNVCVGSDEGIIVGVSVGMNGSGVGDGIGVSLGISVIVGV